MDNININMYDEDDEDIVRSIVLAYITPSNIFEVIHFNLYQPSIHDDIYQTILDESLNQCHLERNAESILKLENEVETGLTTDCMICLETIEGLSTVLECSHNFHKDCILEWGMYKQECPICRRAIPLEEKD